MKHVVRTVVIAFALVALLGVGLASGASWRLEQPPAPDPAPGVAPAPYPVPLGPPGGIASIGDIQFWAPNRGLVAVRGNGLEDKTHGFTGQNGVVKEGLYRWDGVKWSLFSNVCGGQAAGTRIAWAGPHEFWTVSAVPAGQRNQANFALSRTLCHYRDDRFVASYATPDGAADAYLDMNAASCNGPDDCWFAGAALPAPQVGVFQLHWDGHDMNRVIGTQGRPVQDLASFGGDTYEALTISDSDGNARLTTPEPKPLLLHSIAGGAGTAAAIIADPFVSTTTSSVLNNEFTALSSDGTLLWAGGGHATSGPKDGTDPSKQRGPLLAVKALGQPFQEVKLDPTVFGPGVRIVDLAADPGTQSVWLALRDPNASTVAAVAHVDINGTVLAKLTLPLTDDPDPNTKGAATGQAAKIACPATDECWLATDQGWLYHLRGAVPLTLDDDPYFATFQSIRPADATTASDTADVQPIDDSGADLPFIDPTPLPPVVVDEPLATLAPPAPKATKVKVRALSRVKIEVAFRLSARAKVKVRALRGKALVGQTKRQTLNAGAHRLSFTVPGPRRWPNHISLDVTAA